MAGELTKSVMRTIQDAAKKLTGAKRRSFEAQTARDYCQGSARKAETIFGWLDKTYEKGVRLSEKVFRPIDDRLQRSELLPKWSAVILPVAADAGSSHPRAT